MELCASAAKASRNVLQEIPSGEEDFQSMKNFTDQTQDVLFSMP
jgi:hypothetical protein